MKRGLNILLISMLLLLISNEGFAQFYKNQGYWKKDRLSFIGGAGAANFLGELGGRDQAGSDFIWDLETKQFRPVLTAGFRYVTSRKTAVRAQISFAQIGGDDQLTNEPFRHNRNLNFRSNIYEVGAIFEYVFYEVRAGHRYNLTGVKGDKPRAANLYAFLGLMGTHFNPQGYLDGNWYELQPLGTEGQNIEGTPYSLYTMAVPMGIGYRWKLALNNLMLGIEIGHRVTFTDYMDDVSTVYYDNNEILADSGPLGAYFADPSNGFIITENGQIPVEEATAEGAQRGDPDDNDAYLFAQATLQYRLAKKPYRKRKFGAKKGKRVVF